MKLILNVKDKRQALLLKRINDGINSRKISDNNDIITNARYIVQDFAGLSAVGKRITNNANSIISNSDDIVSIKKDIKNIEGLLDDFMIIYKGSLKHLKDLKKII